MTRFGQAIATGILTISSIGAQAQSVENGNEVTGQLAEQRYASEVRNTRYKVANTLLPPGLSYMRVNGHESSTHILGATVYNKTFGVSTQVQVIIGGFKTQDPQNGYSEIRYGGAIILR